MRLREQFGQGRPSALPRAAQAAGAPAGPEPAATMAQAAARPQGLFARRARGCTSAMPASISAKAAQTQGRVALAEQQPSTRARRSR